MLTQLFKPRSLDSLAVRYGTDKSHKCHNFAQFYEKHLAPLRDKPIRFLEIGVGRGCSIRMWTRYFKRGTMYAIECEARRRRYRLWGAEIFIGNQQDRRFLKNVMDEVGPLDLIIDDGSHHVDHQQDSLAFLFPYVKPGGYYILEDIHTSYPKADSTFGLKPDGSNSTHEMLKRFQRTGRFESAHMSDDEQAYLTEQVAECDVYAYQDESRHLTSILKKRGALSV